MTERLISYDDARPSGQRLPPLVVAELNTLYARLDGGGVPGAVQDALDLKADQTAVTAALAGKADLIGGKLDPAQLPDIAIGEFLGVVASQAEMLTLVGERGDWCTRSDTGTDWHVINEPTSSLGSWRQQTYPSDLVSSVAGLTGAISTASLKSALALQNVNNTSDANKPISTATQTALNGKVDKTANANVVYATDGSSVQTTIAIGQSSAAANSMVRRTASGAVFVGDGTDSAHAVNKGQLDAAMASGGIPDGAVTTAKLGDGAVTTVKLGDSQVTSAKIADGTIVNDDIADGTIAKAKLASAVQTSLGKADTALQESPVVIGALPGTGVSGKLYVVP